MKFNDLIINYHGVLGFWEVADVWEIELAELVETVGAEPVLPPVVIKSKD